MESLLKHLVKKDASPYPYQKRIAEAALQGNNIIISAPTGAGKTWAALLPFLYSKIIGRPFSDRLIYSLPMRTLATSLYESTVSSCRRAGWKVLTDPAGNGRGDNQNGICITIQTGERKEDPFYQGDIIFTTIDQMLSGYLNVPVSLPERLANINAGAMVGSLIVLDEIHLLDPERSLSTAIEMCHRLKECSQFIFMTATLSGMAMEILKKHINAELVGVSEEELRLMPSQKSKDKEYKWVDTPLDIENVLAVHRAGRSLVICNSVGRAQEMYHSLKESICRMGLKTKPLLLHSRFFKDDRSRIECMLAEYFGPDACKTDVILVSTQAIEVGIDISADNVHTELAPINTLVQRAGRCARYAGQRGKGTFWICELQVNDKGQHKMGPYRDQAEIINLTRLEVAKPNGKMGFTIEQKLINAVMEKSEVECINRVKMGLNERYRKVNEVVEWAGRPESRWATSDLIRDVDSVSIIINDDPESLDIYKPVEYLSVPRITLCSLQTAYDMNSKPWVAKIPLSGRDDEDANISWIEANSVRQLSASGWLVAVHPNSASYSPELGLELGKGGSSVIHPPAAKPLLFKPRYKCESFRQHSMAVLKHGGKLKAGHGTGLARIAGFLKMDLDSLNKIIDSVLVLHDMGKLSKKWQAAIRARQDLTGPENPVFLSGEPLAHSTFDWEVHGHLLAEFGKPVYQRGNHAMEGAFSIAECLYCYVGEMLKTSSPYEVACCLVSAIARHHHAGTLSLGDFSLVDGAVEYTEDILKECGLGLENWVLKDRPDESQKRSFGEDCILRPSAGGENFLPLYWMLVRLLRLADQASQREVANS